METWLRVYVLPIMKKEYLQIFVKGQAEFLTFLYNTEGVTEKVNRFTEPFHHKLHFAQTFQWCPLQAQNCLHL